MKTAIIRTAAALAMTSVVAFLAGQTQAAAFAAWQVKNVAWGDTLNVRKHPSGGSQKQSAYPNGTVLQMTGKCTGGVNLLDIGKFSDQKQQQLVRHEWCQVWHDPKQNGQYVLGWVYGRYIAPY
jgi:hypothetical protein